MFRIPLTQTTLDEQEVEAAARVIRRQWLTMGEEVAAFETEFAAAIGSPHAVAVSNGTTALEIAYQAAQIEAGSEIILPAITFVACFNAAVRAGLMPVLADVCGPYDLTISVEDVVRKITPRTRAVVSMPFGGHCPDMEALADLCEARGLVLIEDACHAPLARVGGRPIGTFGLGASWSFFGNKNMTTGEGGMITTGDDAFAERCRLIRAHGMTRPTWARVQGLGFSYDVAELGTNARLDEIRAAIGRVQLAKLPAANAERARAAVWLREALEAVAIPGLVAPFANARGESVEHVFVVLLPEGTNREATMEALKRAGIQTSIHYPPLHQFTSTRQWFAIHGGAADLPVTDAIGGRILTLPLGPKSTQAECVEVAEALAAALRAD